MSTGAHRGVRFEVPHSPVHVQQGGTPGGVASPRQGDSGGGVAPDEVDMVVIQWRALQARREQQRKVLDAHIRGLRYLMATAKAEAEGAAPSLGATGTLSQRLDTVGALILDASRELTTLGASLEGEYAEAAMEVRPHAPMPASG